MKLKVGIFFGGPSREREIAFAGGRTVYDNLNKSLFTPVPLFLDSFGNLVLLDWQYIYKGSIRDFFPPIATLPPSPHGFQVYVESLGQMTESQQRELLTRVGRPVRWEELPEHIDLAFLALHGEFGEDGQIQRRLTDLGIAYTGSGVRASEIGIDKALQKELMQGKGFPTPSIQVLDRKAWLRANVHEVYASAADAIGFPLVIRPARQGSSIGVSIIEEKEGLEAFERAVNRAFFRELLPLDEWQDRSDFDRLEYVKLLSDIRDGLGFPLHVTLGGETITHYHPEDLLRHLNEQTAGAEHLSQVFILEGEQSEEKVILEGFIRGKEFSCIVIRTEDGSAVALPPTEIIKGGEVFDYRSKYLPGLSRKETPIKLPAESIEAIRRECERLFTQLGFQVYARIDGFFTDEGNIFLNDPNTTSGMLPSSFFFHQAAEIGLNPSQFLTYILRTSLQERLREQPEQETWRARLRQLDADIAQLHQASRERLRIGVILGGYSYERHISVESGRNVFEKLASSEKYEPIPIFLGGDEREHTLHQLPINLLLKDNADDIREKIAHWALHPTVERIKKECADITKKYASSEVVFAPKVLTYRELAALVDGVFIALHGRPGEDGQVQEQLETFGLPYNGSGVKSSSITIDKYRTLQLLAKNGLPVAQQLLLSRQDYDINPEGFLRRVEQNFAYPLVAKPVDDGCSSAVKVIRDREQLAAYVRLTFELSSDADADRRRLKLKPKEEFPRKSEILFEQLISREDGIHFLEITGGLLTHYDEQGQLTYEVFEPSETLAGGEVLSLEEKFLAGEGQNLTPARLAVNGYDHDRVLAPVRKTLERVARLLGVEGYCRIDAFVRVYADGRVDTQVIEVNSLPGMTPATAIFHQAALAGYQPAAFIDAILSFGFERQRRKAGAVASHPTVAEAAAVSNVVVEPQKETGWKPGAAPIAERPATQGTPLTAKSMEKPAVRPPRASPEPPRPWPDRLRKMRDRMWAFLSSRYFLKNLGAMLVVLILGFFLVNGFLRWYTDHGDSVQVPNYMGMTLEDATRKARSRGFSVSVDYAPYDPSAKPNEVLDQEPPALARIKQNRTIYLTVVGSPRTVMLPEFKEAAYDYDQYAAKLLSLKVSAVKKEEVFDPQYEANTILHAFYRGERLSENDVKRGVEVMQGETVELVVTKNQSDNVVLPSLVCKRYSEAEFLLGGLELQIGEVIGDVPNRSDAYIYRQEPAYTPGQRIRRGSQVTLYLQSGLPAGCEPDPSMTLPDPEDTEEASDSTGME